MKVKVANPDLSQEERTYLTGEYSTGVNLSVRNSEGFTANWFAVVGEPTQEQAEIGQIASNTDANVIVLTAGIDFPHPKSTVVYLSQWNKIAFERKPSGGAFTEISGSPFDIEWDEADGTTTIVVPSGAAADTYRWRFYNSVTADYSDYSDSLSGAGYGRSTVGYVIEQVRRNALSKNIDAETIMDYMNDYQTDVVFPEIPKAWWFSREGTPVATTASTYKYNISTNWSDFRSMKFMLYRYISGSTSETYPLTFSPEVEFRNLKSDANQDTDDKAHFWSMLPPDTNSALGYIGLHPTPETTACYLIPVYQIQLDALNSFGDTLVVPYAKGYIDYVLYRIYDDIKSDETNANKYSSRVKQGIIYLKRLARRQLGQPELFRFRGQRGWSEKFGENPNLNSSEAREMYW